MPLVKPFSGVVGSRTVRAVKRGCVGGKRPRKVDWVDKVGAGAAIWAVVENAKRLSAAGRPEKAEHQAQDSDASSAALQEVSKTGTVSGSSSTILAKLHDHEWSDSDSGGAGGIGETSMQGAEEALKQVSGSITGQSTLSVNIPSTAVHLLDVEHSAKSARDEATQVLARMDSGVCRPDPYGTSSPSSRSPTSREGSDPGLSLSADTEVAEGQDVVMSDGSDQLESEGDELSNTSQRSWGSEYKTRVKLRSTAPRAEEHGAGAIVGNGGIKWSERLRKKVADI